MDLEIKYVKDAGNINHERIILKALKKVQVGEYMIADSTYTVDGQISNILRHIFWIPDKIIQANDLVVIYTKVGHSSEKLNKSGVTTHFFYWDIDRTIWNKEGDNATLFRIKDWLNKKVF
jgi:hypothetical protein